MTYIFLLFIHIHKLQAAIQKKVSHLDPSPGYIIVLNTTAGIGNTQINVRK